MPPQAFPEAFGGGVKHDSDKPPLDLLSAVWLLGVGKVLGYGAKKYAPNNWRAGFDHSRLIAAALRHILAYNSGEDIDPESGISHILHASCCLMFLYELKITGVGKDDRYTTK